MGKGFAIDDKVVQMFCRIYQGGVFGFFQKGHALRDKLGWIY